MPIVTYNFSVLDMMRCENVILKSLPHGFTSLKSKAQVLSCTHIRMTLTIFLIGATIPGLRRVRGVQDPGGRLRGHHLLLHIPEDHRGWSGQRPQRHEDDRHVPPHHKVRHPEGELPQGETRTPLFVFLLWSLFLILQHCSVAATVPAPSTSGMRLRWPSSAPTLTRSCLCRSGWSPRETPGTRTWDTSKLESFCVKMVSWLSSHQTVGTWQLHRFGIGRVSVPVRCGTMGWWKGWTDFYISFPRMLLFQLFFTCRNDTLGVEEAASPIIAFKCKWVGIFGVFFFQCFIIIIRSDGTYAVPEKDEWPICKIKTTTAKPRQYNWNELETFRNIDITAIVNAVKFSMKFADEDLEYNIKYAEILNKKSGSNQVSFNFQNFKEKC